MKDKPAKNSLKKYCLEYQEKKMLKLLQTK